MEEQASSSASNRPSNTSDEREEARGPKVDQKFGKVQTKEFYGNIGTKIDVRGNLEFPPKLPSSDEAFAKLQSVINESTRQQTSPQTPPEELEIPESNVRPSTVEVDFYSSAIAKHEYKPTLEFVQQMQKQEGRAIEPNNFFKAKKGRKRVRSVALVGGAGYGKTEMLKRFSVDVLEKKIPGLEEVEIVHHMNFRDIDKGSRLCLGELLFGHTGLVSKYHGPCTEWISKNGRKFLLVIDGADQYSEELGKSTRSVRNREKKEEATLILDNLLEGKLLPGIRILYSSREHAIRGFGASIRAGRVVALAGLSLGSVEKLVRGYAAEEADWVWNHLETKSQTLLSICSIPMFLVFTVLALIRNKSNPPETLTEVLIIVIGYFITSDHAYSQKTIIKVIHDLKLMSFKGTMERKVAFSLEDLPSSYKELTDLLISLPGNTSHSQHVLEGNLKYIFCHQSLQEALTALHIAEMPLTEFNHFVYRNFNESHWIVVRRLLVGIVLNQSNRLPRGNQGNGVIGEISDLTEKGRHLKNILENQINQAFAKTDPAQSRSQTNRLELLHTLRECGDAANELITNVKYIGIEDLGTLTSSDFQALAFTMNRCSLLDKLEIQVDPVPIELNKLVSIILESDVKTKRCEIGKHLVVDGYDRERGCRRALEVIKLFPRITEELELGMISPGEDDLLQTNLNEMPPTNLRISTAVVWNVGNSGANVIEDENMTISQQRP